MSKEEKQNVIVALMLSVAAVIIIWLWNRGGSNIVIPAAADTNVFPSSTGDTTPSTGYTNYNIPAYAPPGINIGGNTTGIPAAANSNCGCGVPCGPPGTFLGNGWTVANYLQYVGP